MRFDFTRSFDGECSFERDAGGFAGREMSRGVSLRAMDGCATFQKGSAAKHPPPQRGAFFFRLDYLKTLGFGS